MRLKKTIIPIDARYSVNLLEILINLNVIEMLGQSDFVFRGHLAARGPGPGPAAAAAHG